MPERPDRGHVDGPEPARSASPGRPSGRGIRPSRPSTQPMCRTPCTVRIDNLRRPLVLEQVHRGERAAASKSGPAEPSRRSAGNRSRSVGPQLRAGVRAVPAEQLAELPADRPQRPAGAGGAVTPGRPRSICRTSRGRSSGPPGVGSAHTSSRRKSGVSSWMRHGREVCAAFGSLVEVSAARTAASSCARRPRGSRVPATRCRRMAPRGRSMTANVVCSTAARLARPWSRRLTRRRPRASER